ncbi:MAG TPA: urease accessory protein UreE [Opitutaceae bacterium]|nr:urease accessory protein UreE [Opitutaceae bacterium]
MLAVHAAGVSILPMHLVRAPLLSSGSALPEIAVRADRQKLAKRRWRAAADDGVEFGFELEAPLRHGDVVWAGARARYVIRQLPEPVLEIPLDVTPDAAAAIGWAVGNLHFAIEAQATRLLAPDDPGLRQALDRLGIHYHAITAVFQPHRFAGSLGGHGHSHGHDPHHHHDDHAHGHRH